jgi:hypothetical protein
MVYGGLARTTRMLIREDGIHGKPRHAGQGSGPLCGLAEIAKEQ